MKILGSIISIMRPEKTDNSSLNVGDRVFIEPEEKGFPFGHGIITAVGPHRYHPNPKKWYSVLLDRPAQRHASDGPPRREWRISELAIRPA